MPDDGTSDGAQGTCPRTKWCFEHPGINAVAISGFHVAVELRRTDFTANAIADCSAEIDTRAALRAGLAIGAANNGIELDRIDCGPFGGGYLACLRGHVSGLGASRAARLAETWTPQTRNLRAAFASW